MCHDMDTCDVCHHDTFERGIDMALYSEKTLNDIRTARRLFSQGEAVPDGLIRQEILASWQRSRNFGLDFNVSAKTVLSPQELKERMEKHALLLQIAQPILDILTQFTNNSGFLTVLADEDGYVLFIRGEDSICELAKKQNNMVLGSNRNEKEVGTNAIGTVIQIRKPIQMTSYEHYYPMEKNWLCSAAPIFGSENNIIGVLNLSGFIQNVSYHTLGMVVSAATVISQQVAMHESYNQITAINDMLNTIINNIQSSIIMISRSGYIINVNKNCSKLLNLNMDNLIGKHIKNVFFDDAPTENEIKNGIYSKSILYIKDNNATNIIMNIYPTKTGEAIITLEKTETLQKKASNLIGSKAYFTFDDIIGSSPVLQNAISVGRLLATNDSNVLITGESGTGKELFAQAIHNASDRRNGPFLAINCGALPKSLIESELFGYVGNSFTGADKAGRAGKFELANGGTIFLDEIGDMPFDVQAHLLRVIQNREVYRIGSSLPVKINVRIIAATNKNLSEEIKRNTFRLDLYYRLNVFNIYIPPLRERKEDIKLLIDFFIKRYEKDSNKENIHIDNDVYKFLKEKNWPGNVRELENYIERLVYMCNDNRIKIDDCYYGDDLNSYIEMPVAVKKKNKLKKEDIINALKETNANINKTAAMLSCSRKTLYRKFIEFSIDYQQYRK